MDKDYPVNIPAQYEKLLAKDIPWDIEKIGDDIIDRVIICEVSGRPFRIVKQELEFYRRHHLPIPHKHQEIRQQERLLQRPGRDLYLRKCSSCGDEIISVYPQDSTFKIYCEACYNKEIY